MHASWRRILTRAIVEPVPSEAEFVIIECSNCHARYQYDEDRFERKPSKKIKCAKCSTVFEIHNPAYSAQKEETPGEMTYTRREAPKKKPSETTEESGRPSVTTVPKPTDP